jgi:hypothetical protein
MRQLPSLEFKLIMEGLDELLEEIKDVGVHGEWDDDWGDSGGTKHRVNNNGTTKHREPPMKVV